MFSAPRKEGAREGNAGAPRADPRNLPNALRKSLGKQWFSHVREGGTWLIQRPPFGRHGKSYGSSKSFKKHGETLLFRPGSKTRSYNMPGDQQTRPRNHIFPMLFKGFRITVRFPMPPEGGPLNQPRSTFTDVRKPLFPMISIGHWASVLGSARGAPALPSLAPSFRGAQNAVFQCFLKDFE